MHTADNGRPRPVALSLLASERPRNVSWLQAGGLLFGDWGTSRLYVLGLAFLFAGRTSFWLILLMSVLILCVGWAYTQICRIYPDGGGVYTAAKHRSRILAVIGALLLFADYTVTASLSALDAFHYFGLPLTKHVLKHEEKMPVRGPTVADEGGDKIRIVHDDTDENREPLMAMPARADLSSFKGRIDYDAKGQELVARGAMTYHDRDSLLSMSSDPAYQKAVVSLYNQAKAEELLAWDSPGMWAMIAILAIGLFNLMGPKHTGGFALFAAIGMVVITLLITLGALPQVQWSELPHRIGTMNQQPWNLWTGFVSIVLALSGVEAIANLTGVMKRPVAHTAKKAIWVVAAEVAIFNVLLAIAMVAIANPPARSAHTADMMSFLALQYIGGWAQFAVGLIGGTLLLSAANTAITDMISVQYLMARDNELPPMLQALNRFGVPWVPAVVAASVPCLVLLVSHDLERLAALYAIGVIGAVAINISLVAWHPRLRRLHRKIPMVALGLVLLAIWVTLALVKHEALLFVLIVMSIGLSARQLNRWWIRRKGPQPSLLKRATLEQLSPDALLRPKLLIGTYGSDAIASAALEEARKEQATLVVCFIREVQLSYKYENKMTLDSDLAAQKTFARFLEMGHEKGVPVMPVYDQGPDAAELMAEAAAMNGCAKVLIGTTRKGALYHLIKGHFQRRLESLLPPEIAVQVISPDGAERSGSDSPVHNN